MSVSPGRVGRMVRKELRQMLRDIRMRGIIFVAPIVQLVVFGYAVSTDVREVPLAVADFDRSAASRALVDQITASKYFILAGMVDSDAELTRALERGDAVIGMEIPAGYGADLVGPGGAAVQVLVDGTDSNTGNIALNYLLRIGVMIEAERAVVTPPIRFEARAWYNPSLESRVWNVPAVMGAILLIITMLLTSLSVVREREIGTWEQLVVSPVTPAELMLGKTLPVALIGVVDMILVTAVAVLWFEIPFRGAPLLLLLAAVPYVVAGLSIGLLVSTISRTQQEAFMSMFLILLPTLILSGFMFPVTSMPEAFQWLTLLNPLRHFLEVVRAVFLKGAGLADLWPQFLALVLMAVAGLGLAVRRFRVMIS